MTFGENLKQHRLEKHYTQEQLAEEFQVTRQTVSKWELDQVMPETGKLVEIAEYFGISLDEMILCKQHYENSEMLPVQQPVEYTETKRKKDCSYVKYILGIGTIVLYLMYDVRTGHWVPARVYDESFFIILLSTIVVGMFVRQLQSHKVNHKKWAAITAMITGLLTSLQYTYGYLASHQLELGWKIAILPMIYGIMISFVFYMKKN